MGGKVYRCKIFCSRDTVAYTALRLILDMNRDVVGISYTFARTHDPAPGAGNLRARTLQFVIPRIRNRLELNFYLRK